MVRDFLPSLSTPDLARYVGAQLQAITPSPDHDQERLERHVAEAQTRLFDCFRQIKKKYYQEDGKVLFNHLNTDHWAAFLYLLSSTVYRSGGDETLASRVFVLNKALNGVDAFYGIQLPEVFLFVHPVGTVLGNGKYGNYFVVYQNCGVGATESGYPTFGEGVVLYARSACLGGCQVGSDVVFGANAFLIDEDVPDRRVVVGQFPRHKVKENDVPTRVRVFGHAE
jgi:serine O-acetyltransferase